MTLSIPGPATEILREGWFYGGTYLGGEYGDAYREPELRSPKCTLFVVRAQVRRGPRGKTRVFAEHDVVVFEGVGAMCAWIGEHDATELPAEADGDPRYVPQGFRL